MNELIYRPQNKDQQELINDFVIRKLEYGKIMDSIKADTPGNAPQHIVIQGQRGMGKTTLMYRVFYEIQNELRKKGIVPLIFSEEMYGVRTLYKLWEHIAQYLDDNEPEYAGIWFEMQNIQDDDTYADKCFEILNRKVKANKHRLVLLNDNFGIMVDKFTKLEQHRLREILNTIPHLKIIGGSSVMLESFFKYDKPFFDFFKVIQLKPLTSEEVKTLLLHLGEKHNVPHITEIVKKQPGRIEAMRILTGGVPRTIVLLFKIFMDDKKGNSIEDLKELLDMVTPLYKHRMDDLPPQQQEIIEKLSLNWDGMSVSELAQKTRMESKAVSAQLNYLVKSGMVNVTPSTGKNNFYQLEERFFNIWYLMQHAPRNTRQKVIWLTRFLELDYNNQQTESIIKKLLKNEPGIKSNIANIKYLLWANKPEEAISLLETNLPELLADENWLMSLLDLLAFAIAKGLRQYVLKLFNKEEYKLKDKLKVLYYALMKLMKDEYPNEIRKMGKELEEPVDKTLQYIRQLEKKYGN